MFWVRLIFVLVIASLLIFLIYKKVYNNEVKILLITYIVATLIRAITGIHYNLFFDKFNLVLFIKDIAVWTLSYVAVRVVITKLRRSNYN